MTYIMGARLVSKDEKVVHALGADFKQQPIIKDKEELSILIKLENVPTSKHLTI